MTTLKKMDAITLTPDEQRVAVVAVNTFRGDARRVTLASLSEHTVVFTRMMCARGLECLNAPGLEDLHPDTDTLIDLVGKLDDALRKEGA